MTDPILAKDIKDRRDEAAAELERNRQMNDLIKGLAADERARQRTAGPPSREICLAVKQKLLDRGGEPAGYGSVLKALKADGWTVTLDQVRYRLREPQP